MNILRQKNVRQQPRVSADWVVGISWVVALLVMLLLLALPHPARGQPSQRLQAVHTLIEKSSAAKRVAQSDNAEVRKLHENARKQYELAEAALKEGDETNAVQYLNTAVAEMTRATQLAGSGTGKLEKRQNEYQAKLRSVESLLTAYKRIIEEKAVEKSTDITQTVEGHIKSSSEFMNHGDLTRAEQQLEVGYGVVTTSLERLRKGETLVRSLNFSSKEEEFKYELDRNDTHKMLIKVLLTEQENPNQMASSFIKKADSLRLAAENLSAQGKFGEAIKTIEESTKNLVRAIRSSGVYIPG